MKTFPCEHPGCGSRARGTSRYCSPACQAAADSAGDCPCGHKACATSEEILGDAARDAGVDLGELEREGRKLREEH